MNFAEIIINILKEKKITSTKMLSDLELGKNQLMYWKKNESIPKWETVEKIAEYLDVSVDYLLGKTDVKKATEKNNSDYTLNEQQQIQKYRLLNADGKEKVDMYIDDLLDNPKYQADAEGSKEAMVEIKIAARPKHGTEQPESIFIETDLDISDFEQEDPDFLDK